MIKSVTVINLRNPSDELKIELTSPEISQGFAISNIKGLGPGALTINSTEYVTVDGGNIDSTHFDSRDINFNIILTDMNIERNDLIEDVRVRTYKWFALGTRVRLIFEMDKGKYWIEGTVVSNEPEIFSEKEGTSIAVKCDDPNFKLTSSIRHSFTEIKPLFHFPFGIEKEPGVPVSAIIRRKKIVVNNVSTKPVGAVFTLSAVGGVVVNPEITNETTNETLGLTVNMYPSTTVGTTSNTYKITIDMREKYRAIYDAIGGRHMAWFNNAVNDNKEIIGKWFLLQPGENTISALAAEVGSINTFDFLDLSMEVTPIYEGI